MTIQSPVSTEKPDISQMPGKDIQRGKEPYFSKSPDAGNAVFPRTASEGRKENQRIPTEEKSYPYIASWNQADALHDNLEAIKAFATYEINLLDQVLDQIRDERLDRDCIELAHQLVIFNHDLDPYSFNDNVDSPEEALKQALDDITDNRGQGAIEFLKGVIEESNDPEMLDRATDLLDQVQQIEEQIPDLTLEMNHGMSR